MQHEVDVVVGQIVSAIGAAVGAYGTGVLTRVEERAADGTVGLGQRILARLMHHASRREPLETAVADLAENGRDADALGALRLQVRKILSANPELVEELAEAAKQAGLLPTAPPVTASGARSVAIGGNNSGTISTGDHASVLDPG